MAMESKFGTWCCDLLLRIEDWDGGLVEHIDEHTSSSLEGVPSEVCIMSSGIGRNTRVELPPSSGGLSL
jgi:hypothetical protein